jgi:hypothetical protein
MDERKNTKEQAPVDDGRRKLIKAAAIAGGAAAAAVTLPAAWKKPLATVGGLPAHAQTSDAPIRALAFLSIGPGNAGQVTGQNAIPSVTAQFSFEDPLCEIDDTATLWAQTGPCDIIVFDHERLRDIGATLSTPGGCSGKITFSYVNNCSPTYMGSLAVQLSKGSRHSNILNGTFNFG